MKPWQVQCLYFLVLNAAVQYVTSLEEELSDSIFGKLSTQNGRNNRKRLFIYGFVPLQARVKNLVRSEFVDATDTVLWFMLCVIKPAVGNNLLI